MYIEVKKGYMIYNPYLYVPSKQNLCITLILYNVGPTSSTFVQHRTNVIQMFCVYWVSPCRLAGRWLYTSQWSSSV